MSTQYTPGPWVARPQGDANDWCLLTADDKWMAAFRQNGELMVARQEANARLIAAAPEMLEALRGLLDPATNEDGAWYRQAREAARAALAKATEAA